MDGGVQGDYPEQLRQAVKKCISKAARECILTKFIPLVARVHIFLARWSAGDAPQDVRAPDGAGGQRAQQSFDATAAAAGGGELLALALVCVYVRVRVCVCVVFR